MKAVLYARFSPRPKADESESLDYQFAEMRRHAEARKYPVFDEHCYSDPDTSGTELDRPGLWAAIAALEVGDVFVVYKLDRLARGDVVLPYALEQEIQRQGATLESCSDEGTWGDSDADQNWLVRRIAQLFAEYHRRITVARTKAAMRRYQATGRRMSARLLFGLRLDPDDPTRTVLDPLEQRQIERVLKLWDELRSLRGVATAMNEEGERYRDHRWYASGVQRILESAGLRERSKPKKKHKAKRDEQIIATALGTRRRPG